MRKAARGLARLGVTFDVILTSPLVRTRQTAEIVAAAFDLRPPIVAVESLADLQDLLEDTRYGFLVAIPLGLFLAWLGGSALARRSLAPVSAMTTRAAAPSPASAASADRRSAQLACGGSSRLRRGRRG